MPFAPFPRPPHRSALPAPELRRKAARPSTPYPGPLTREQVQLAPVPDQSEAARHWAAHLDAGRIGVPALAPPPPPPGCDYGLASLARILGPACRRRGA